MEKQIVLTLSISEVQTIVDHLHQFGLHKNVYLLIPKIQSQASSQLKLKDDEIEDIPIHKK